MKNNHPITEQQRHFDETIHIVSTTDLKGATTYANQDFIDISGFSRDEIIGKNHNIVRHPDMPAAAFTNLWNDIKQGKSWMGIVKNRCANGDYYWVDAFVTPIFNGKTITGYQSVRLKPNDEQIKNAKNLYQQLSSPSSLWDRLLKLFQLSLMGKIIAASITSLTIGILTAMSLGSTFSIANIAALAATLTSSLILAKLVARPWQEAASASTMPPQNYKVRQCKPSNRFNKQRLIWVNKT